MIQSGPNWKTKWKSAILSVAKIKAKAFEESVFAKVGILPICIVVRC